MFKSCCSRPNKKVSKSKPKDETMDKVQETKSSSDIKCDSSSEQINKEFGNKETLESKVQLSRENLQIDLKIDHSESSSDIGEKEGDCNKVADKKCDTIEKSLAAEKLESANRDLFDQGIDKRELMKKRYSVDYKRSRHDFKRYSVDCRNDSSTLEELSRLEKELARTNVDVRPPRRRKSVGILKSTTSYNEVAEQRTSERTESYSEDDEVFEVAGDGVDQEGPRDPPATPVGRDELALRRHRFYSDLVCAARAAVEHRVRFDPLGPVVAGTGKIISVLNI